MISKELTEMINAQIQFEMHSSNVYLGMESYFRDLSYDGFATWMKVQAEEELLHARFFMEFLVRNGEKFEMRAIDAAANEFKDVKEVFNKALAHEKEVTKRIYALYEQASKDKNYYAQKFLNWFVDEQAEEEDNFSTFVTKLERVKDDSGLFFLDQESASRTLTQPSNPPITVG